ncbi:FecCD family ABC transporter permease [Sporomusa acidovorans]|uniref:ABC transporter permease protein n=1 Tax=Sporomusa acidovorans (strain ATCC 49682 / DSM 3132 / Mol) TaxID=1123286 RepID=A0ABZ3J5P4_SPOA4|nr:iron ABC transporter permease [Sporomusa acidovorans]OZC15400.1 putative ABC transporter permease protein [Sporomusa acidovorans DSM 3132]SDF13344.1 iron complex transport system permease protein [Sporomusa acidovorans]
MGNNSLAQPTVNKPAVLLKKDKGVRQIRKDLAKLTIMLAVLVLAFFASFLVGRYPVSPDIVLAILCSKVVALPQVWNDTLETIVFKIRLPRIAAALLVGSALAVSGAAYQNLFRNPLVSPSLLGASWGAAFGAVLGMILHLSWIWVEISAFAFGLVAVLTAIAVGSWFGNKSMISLVLAGIAVSAFFQALVSVLKYLADPMNTLPEISFWLMGGLSKIKEQDVVWSLLPILLPMIILYFVRWQINVLSIGEEEAHTLGVNVRRTRLVVLACATLLAAAATSIGGIIQWVGLLIPHAVRMLFGANFAIVLPASVVTGATFLLIMDNLSRSIASLEIQVGILTSLLGAPFFVFLLAKAKRGWE